VIWIVPEAMTALTSPVFGAGGRIFADYPGIGDEVVSLLRTSEAGSADWRAARQAPPGPAGLVARRFPDVSGNLQRRSSEFEPA
jgi:hypothetical protein